MIRRILRFFGYLKVEYGFTSGGKWITIDGKTISSSGGSDVTMLEADIEVLGRALLPGCVRSWPTPPNCNARRSSIYSRLDPLLKCRNAPCKYPMCGCTYE